MDCSWYIEGRFMELAIADALTASELRSLSHGSGAGPPLFW
jgi:hypothetical protein